MASAADVRSILSLPAASATPGPSQPKRPHTASARKPDGISRELYSLIGPSAPSLAAQLAKAKPRLKQKPNLGAGGRWEMRAFRNGARSDGLMLSHWEKATADPVADYPFAKYNVQATAYTYSQDEYTRFLEDKEWTKEETDYLFRIAQEYDTRWYVIHDRYEYPGGVPRSLEDLKDRYYSVCRKLVRNRPWAGDEASKAQLISSFQFDKERETMRKMYVASLENRTPEQIAEEEALLIEIKRLEQSERRFKKDREELLRALAGIDSGLPDIAEDDSTLALAVDTKKKKKGAAMELDTPATPSNIISLGPPVTKKVQPAKSAAYDALHCIMRTDPPPVTATTKVVHQPAFARSYKIPQYKSPIMPKLAQALGELGLLATRLVMPTRDNCALLESLLEATSALLDTKKIVDKVNQDILILKTRLGQVPAEGAGATGESKAADAEAEPERGESVADDGRAQSVVSTRSGRGRKQSRRSVSISSVDTSATAGRKGTKRQKRE